MRILNGLSMCLVCIVFLSDCSVCRDDSAMVAKLRSKLKHKFILDFLIERKPEVKYRFEDRLMEMAMDSSSFEIIDNPINLNVAHPLEAFSYYEDYVIYRVPSFNGREQYYLLVLGMLHPNELYLLADDTTRAILLDTLDVHTAGGSYMDFLTLNGKNVLKLSRIAPGVGFYFEQEAIAGLIDRRFKILFSIKTLEATNWTMDDKDSTERDKFFRTMSSYKFVDLNGDGFLDIVEETTEDIILPDESENSMGDDYRKGKVVSNVSKSENQFLWNDITYTFDKVK
ncbi:MAG: hypothetical protein ABSF91_10795 [Bacteroidota bacterium]